MSCGMVADLLIRAECMFPDRRVPGFVLRLSRREAYFLTRRRISAGERGRLSLELPWHLGRIDVPVEVAPQSSADPRSPGIGLSFRSVTRSQLDSIERYLTRYYHLLAQLQT
jgi:hypothetical protein